MNKLGFGFLRLPKNHDQYDMDTLNQMVDLYLSQGRNYFDTCYTYLKGNSELMLKKCVVERYPRETYQIADKLPGYMCKCEEDNLKYFNEELERCGVDYFDVYMLHWLNEENYQIAQRYHQFEFIQGLKEKGLAKRIGFSYHDSADLLDTILKEHPEIDVVQLQINYLDWESQGIQSQKCYEVCKKYKKSIIVMEPVKGGSLALLPKEAEAVLKQIHPDWSSAKWALAFVESLDQVEICLSGMNSITQMQENLLDFDPLNKQEIELLAKIVEMIKKNTAIQCTGCRYCVDHCPKGILIPDYFAMYNELYRYPSEDWKVIPSYIQMTKKAGKAQACIQCGSCARHCPQHLEIPALMKDVSKVLDA